MRSTTVTKIGFLLIIGFLLAIGIVSALVEVGVVAPTANSHLGGTVLLNATANNDSVNMTWQFYQGNTMVFNFTNSSGVNISSSNKTLFVLSVNTLLITEGIYNITANASNSSGVRAINASGTNVTIDNTPPSVSATTTTAEPDLFYSTFAANSVIRIRVSITETGSGIEALNMTVDNATYLNGNNATLSFNASSGFWETNFTVLNATANGFVNRNFTLSGRDRAGNNLTGYGGLVVTIVGMETPPSSSCFQFGSRSTNFTRELNWSAVNFVMQPQINGSTSCNGGDAMPWGATFKTVALLNFTRLNFTDSAVQNSLANLGTAIDIDISLPREYGSSRIFINTTAFAALNTNSTLEMYDLPFASRPSIVEDVGAGGANSTFTWIQGIDGGNLTFSVFGFSGYNISDTLNPVLTVVLPLNNSNQTNTTVMLNVTLNGTGTDINTTSIQINITPANLILNYSNLSCFSSVNDTFSCNATLTVSEGNQTITVYAEDYGGTGGHNATVQSKVNIDPSAPVLTFVEPSAVNKSFTDTFTASVTVTDTSRVIRVNYSIYNQSNVSQQYRNGTLTLSGTSATASIAITGLQGAYTFYVNATDANNLVTNLTRDFKFDSVPPGPITFSLAPSTAKVGVSIVGTCTSPDTFSSATTVITGIDTTTTGSKTATCTATDVAGNTATLGASYTVTAASASDSGGGGGSGGSGATYSAVAGASVGASTASAGTETTLDIPKYDGIAFGAITFTSSEDLKDIEISVHKYSTAPVGTDPIEGLAYQYIKIDEKNIKGVTSVLITFKVAKDWLDTNKVAKEHISLYRWTGSSWTEFKAGVTSEDTTHVFYKATVSGLSVFAIGRSSTAQATEEKTAEPAPTPTPAPTPAVAPAKSSKSWLFVLGLLVIVAVAIVYARRSKKHHDKSN